ncbi:Hly-III related family protein [Heterostelium album PN500]|uniref:Hly-III related family protein n=1 Tax=Heterostelium pallidum (strain ATCC 26659 / Pp 5 / PN500) TaxID=670386 RepID=D3BEW9_HETP5|nr:Hly-III related family protein [Heterostelium album PN500]EFA80450.1 Hly-III related family protein [Heterostelium album PN500]|eukprot:XP_020432570.1 Hly-III related family protein [Heterostelium album PN500]
MKKQLILVLVLALLLNSFIMLSNADSSEDETSSFEEPSSESSDGDSDYEDFEDFGNCYKDYKDNYIDKGRGGNLNFNTKFENTTWQAMSDSYNCSDSFSESVAGIHHDETIEINSHNNNNNNNNDDRDDTTDKDGANTPPIVTDMLCMVVPAATEFADVGMLMEDSSQQLLEEEILEFNETPTLNDIISANELLLSTSSSSDIISSNTSQHKHLHLNDICHCGDIDSFIELMTTENPFILSGFREYTTRSFKQCTRSIFKLHNDTGNIWTHLIPACIYLYMALNELVVVQGRKQLMFTMSTYKMNLLAYLFSCFLCFFASSVYHTYRSYSLAIYKKTLMFDVSSIGLVILTSVNLIIYSELYCYPNVRTLSLCSFFFLIAAALSLLPKIMREKRFSLRTLIFSFLALQGLLSHLLRLYLDSVNHPDFKYSFIEDSNFQWLILAYLLMSIGLSIRRVKFPELLSPGKFDIFYLNDYNTYAGGNGRECCIPRIKE